jgi:hypothetical protein
MCDQSDQKKQQIDLLVEEWKQNVALYIDQDKRGFTRIQWFWALNAGFFVLFQYIPYSVKVILALIAVIMAFITHMMSRRAHDYIRLRIVQARLIEVTLKKLIDPCSELKTDSGILTTFSREHAIYVDKKGETDSGFHQSLIDEIEETLGNYTAKVFKKKQRFFECLKQDNCDEKKECLRRWYSIKHLTWLDWMFVTIIALWSVIFISCLFTGYFLKPPILPNETSYKTVEFGYYGKIFENKSDEKVFVTIHTINNCIENFPFLQSIPKTSIGDSNIYLQNNRSSTSIAFSVPPEGEIYLSCSKEGFRSRMENRFWHGEKTGLSYTIDPL